MPADWHSTLRRSGDLRGTRTSSSSPKRAGSSSSVASGSPSSCRGHRRFRYPPPPPPPVSAPAGFLLPSLPAPAPPRPPWGSPVGTRRGLPRSSSSGSGAAFPRPPGGRPLPCSGSTVAPVVSFASLSPRGDEGRLTAPLGEMSEEEGRGSSRSGEEATAAAGAAVLSSPSEASHAPLPAKRTDGAAGSPRSRGLAAADGAASFLADLRPLRETSAEELWYAAGGSFPMPPKPVPADDEGILVTFAPPSATAVLSRFSAGQSPSWAALKPPPPPPGPFSPPPSHKDGYVPTLPELK